MAGAAHSVSTIALALLISCLCLGPLSPTLMLVSSQGPSAPQPAALINLDVCVKIGETVFEFCCSALGNNITSATQTVCEAVNQATGPSVNATVSAATADGWAKMVLKECGVDVSNITCSI